MFSAPLSIGDAVSGELCAVRACLVGNMASKKVRNLTVMNFVIKDGTDFTGKKREAGNGTGEDLQAGGVCWPDRRITAEISAYGRLDEPHGDKGSQTGIGSFGLERGSFAGMDQGRTASYAIPPGGGNGSFPFGL